MKEFIDMLTDENKSLDGLDWWFYAFVCPAILVLVAILISIAEEMVNNNFL